MKRRLAILFQRSRLLHYIGSQTPDLHRPLLLQILFALLLSRHTHLLFFSLFRVFLRLKWVLIIAFYLFFIFLLNFFFQFFFLFLSRIFFRFLLFSKINFVLFVVSFLILFEILGLLLILLSIVVWVPMLWLLSVDYLWLILILLMLIFFWKLTWIIEFLWFYLFSRILDLYFDLWQFCQIIFLVILGSVLPPFAFTFCALLSFCFSFAFLNWVS